MQSNPKCPDLKSTPIINKKVVQIVVIKCYPVTSQPKQKLCPHSWQPSVEQLEWESEALVLDQKRVECPQVRDKSLPCAAEYKCLGIFIFTSDGRMGREMDQWTGASSPVMRILFWLAVVKKAELKGNLSIYKSAYVPALTCGCGASIKTKDTS